MFKYLPRLIEKTIEKQLKAMGGIVIEGPKWCGKSTTAKRFAKTIVELQKPQVLRRYRAFAETSEENLLAGERPIMFDEWQKIPDIWDYVRASIDDEKEKGQYILTGSAKPVEDSDRHSGTGRIARVIMRPMSLWESKESSGSVSLGELFAGNDKVNGTSKISFNELAFIACRGGYPESISQDKEFALMAARNYLQSLISTDLGEVDGIKRNPERAKRILRSYARNISSFATLKTMQDDVIVNDTTLDFRTLESYLGALKKLFVIEEVVAWSPKLRSKATIRSANKRQFCDPSLAAAVLGASPEDLIEDLNTFGLMFESLCDRDLRVYTEALGGEVYHYRDNTGLEADAIIHLNNGRWGAVEIKLGGDQIDEAAKHLIMLKDKIDANDVKESEFLMVLTGTQYAYKRSDGVLVVPIGCLKE